MSRAPDTVRESVDRMMQAAQRLQDAPARITPEEVALLGECSSRLRLVRGTLSAPERVEQPTTERLSFVPMRAVGN